jgi:S-adenosylmethionine-dependent methyltransferase
MSMSSDTIFDAIAKSFEEEIYGSSKGYIRERVLWEDMLSEIPQITRGALSILDAGGGAGRMALRMGRFGNNVILYAIPHERC